MIFILSFVNIIFTFLIYLKRDKFSKKLNLILSPQKKSVHKKNSYVIGGIILFLSLILSIIYFYSTNSNIIYFNLFLITGFFIIALVDDMVKITPAYRIFFCILVLFFTTYFDNTLNIITLNFYYFDLLYFPENKFVKYIFPIICILIFVNAFNFIDGIDGLGILVGLSIIFYLIINNNNVLVYFIFLIPSLLFLFYLNLKKSIFLGDSGNYLLSTIISCILIKENHFNYNLFYAEEIFLLLIIPGLDLIRLFFKRIINKKNPLLGDYDHLHHKLYFKYGLKNTLIIYFILINFPLYIFYFKNNLLLFSLIISFLSYLFILFYLTKKIKKKF